MREKEHSVFCSSHLNQGQDCKLDNNDEKICRSILLEELPRYQWARLRHPRLDFDETMRNLELDFYCADLQLAVEYNGPYHYRRDLHRSDESFARRQKLDRLKVEGCRDNGIYLIVAKYGPEEEVRKFLRDRIRKWKSGILNSR